MFRTLKVCLALVAMLAMTGWALGADWNIFDNYPVDELVYPGAYPDWAPWLLDDNANNYVRTDPDPDYVGDLCMESSVASDMCHTTDIISGLWEYRVRQYIPSTCTGDPMLIWLNDYTESAAVHWAVELRMDTTNGRVYDDIGGAYINQLVTDTWVDVRLVIDLDRDRVTAYYNNQAVDFERVWANDAGSDVHLDCLDVWSNGCSESYVDDIYVDQVLGLTWDNNGGGGDHTWGAGVNWNPNEVPSAAKTALISNATSDTVVVGAAGGVAYGLTVEAPNNVQITGGGRLQIDNLALLETGTQLIMGTGTTFACGGGSADEVTIDTSGTIEVNYGSHAVFSVDSLTVTNGGGTFTKTGTGTLQTDNRGKGTLSLANTAVLVQGGTLATRGSDPLGGATDVTLAGGTLSVGDGSGAIAAGPAGALAHFAFEDNLTDSTGNGSPDGVDYTGTWHGTDPAGPHYEAGMVGQGLHFNPDPLTYDDDWIDLPPGMQDFTGGMTISVWTKFDSHKWGRLVDMSSTDLGWTDLITFGNQDGGSNLWFETRNRFGDHSVTGGWSSQAVNPPVVELDEWQNLVVTMDADGNTTVYVDGSPVLQRLERMLPLDVVRESLIGVCGGIATEIFEGTMDELYVYPYALTPAQVAAMAGVDSANVSNIDVTVTGPDSGIHAASAVDLAFQSLRMENGAVLSTTSGASTVGVSFGSTTIAEDATAVGFDPQAPTDYGTITVEGAKADLVIAKEGPGTWVLGTPTIFAGDTGRVSFAVNGGVMQLVGDGGALAGRPVVVNRPDPAEAGGTLVTDATALGASTVTLNGGTFEGRATGESVQAPPSDALGVWDFDNHLTDSTGNHHTLVKMTCTGGVIATDPGGDVYVAGKRGQALVFDGQTDFLDLPTGERADLQNFGDGFSIAFWGKFDDLCYWQRIFDWQDVGLGGNSIQIETHPTPNDEALCYEIRPNYAMVAPAGSFGGSDWHQYTISVDENGYVMFYTDGEVVQEGQGVLPSNIIRRGFLSGSTYYYFIGQSAWTPTTSAETYMGLMDDLALYNRPLTGGEIAGMAGKGTVDLSDVPLTVMSSSTIHTDASAGMYGEVTLQNGTLTTTAVNPGVPVSIEEVIIPADATSVGLDPQTPTTYSAITVVADKSPVSFAKEGPGTWTVGTPTPFAGDMGRVSFEVNGGVLEVTGDGGALVGRPVSVNTDGTLKVADDGPLGTSAVTLNGGTLQLEVVDDPTVPGGAVASYTFDNSGDLGHDDSGNSRDLFVFGAPESVSDGRVGKAIQLHGDHATEDFFISMGDPSVPEAVAGSSFTVTRWMRAWNGRVALEYDMSFNTDTGVDIFRMGYGQSERVRLGKYYAWEYGNVVRDGDWHNIALEVDLDADAYSAYVDGVQVATMSISNAPALGATPGCIATVGANDWFFLGILGREVFTGYYSGLMDDVLVYDRVLSLQELAQVAGSVKDMSALDLAVTDDSTLDLVGVSAAQFGKLTMGGGTLTSAGMPGAVAMFDGMDINAAAVGLSTETSVEINNAINVSVPAVLTKTGAQDLLLVGTGGGTGLQNLTIDVQEGTLTALNQSNPLGAASVGLAGGGLVLAADATPALYDNAVTVSSGFKTSTLTAGSGGVGADDVDVTLGSTDKGNGLEVGGKLKVQTTDGYTLDIAGVVSEPVKGSGEIYVAPGSDVTLSAPGGTVGSLYVKDSTASTAGNDLTITDKLRINDVTYAHQPSAGGQTFKAASTDMVAGRDLTLGGGTLQIFEGAPSGDIEGDFANFQLNGNAEAQADLVPEILPGPPETLILCSAVNSESCSAFYQDRQSVSAFDVHFQFQLSDCSIPPADGFGLVIQNDPRGAEALGGGGGGLGYGFTTPITDSVVVLFNYYNGNPLGVQLTTNGYMDVSAYQPMGDIVLGTDTIKNPVSIDLAYDGYELTLHMVENVPDPDPDHEFTTSWQVDIPGILGDDMAYFGLCGGTGSLNGRQVFNFFSNVTEVPGALDASTSNLRVTADSTIDPQCEEFYLNDLSLDSGTTLTMTTALVLNLNDLYLGDAATLDAYTFVAGTLKPGDSKGVGVGQGTIYALEMPEEGAPATYAVTLSGDEADKVTVQDTSVVGGTLAVQGICRSTTIKDQTVTIMEVDPLASPEVVIYGEFGELEGSTIPLSYGGQNYHSGSATMPPVPAPKNGTYLGGGKWFGVAADGSGWTGSPGNWDWTAVDNGVYYTDLGLGTRAISIGFFQAKQGDATGDRIIDFSDFVPMFNNWTGSNPPPGTVRDWTQGEFTCDNKIDFSDFVPMFNNWTGSTAEYGEPAGEKALGEGKVVPVIELRVFLVDTDDPDLGPMTAGQCGMVGDECDLSGYDVLSLSGSLVPDPDNTATPFQFYFSNTEQQITAGNIPLAWHFPGALKFDWGFNVSLKDQDLAFRYSPAYMNETYGDVLYIVPEPGTLILLAFGSLGLLVLAIRRRRRAA